ncbi:thiol-disulfide oxidoreductase DCC family protein [Streptomyces physcomitrii]|uniref:DUF393 domain-containing protein n=1 Tax=Streptomyces physcomitrii TaxID=2724184 RepID=A0ABX1H0C1_9ACTN|nr:DCC1-like thiol-disulfide oxidoreductase family protein [Streptomyces physcomitrii]NKI40516.1 DUF393 domain-containing protein [Streptomyces physcomitrii]
MTAQPSGADRGAARVPVRGLTVLYDPDCSLCAHLSRWLRRQRQLVPLELLPAASPEARRRYPGLDHRATLDEITVVGDSGQVYTGTAAWVVVLWALSEYRELAHRMSSPTGARFARGAVLAAAKWRAAQLPARAPVRGGHPGSGWGGGAYRQQDGWTYRPGSGWTMEPPGACAGGECGTR